MGVVKSIFSRPKAPKITQVTQESVPTPTIDQASQNAEDDMRLRRRKGRAAYNLSRQGGMGAPAAPNVGVKTLTGQ